MKSEEIIVLDGVSAMLAMDTARAAVAAATQSVLLGPELFSKHVDLAFAALISAGDDLAKFREKALKSFALDPKLKSQEKSQPI